MSSAHPACDCAWTRAASDAWIDGELAADQTAALELAVARCDACRAYRDSLASYKALVASVAVPPLPAALAPRLRLDTLDRRARELAPPTPRAVHAARAAGALAAGLVAWIAIGIVVDHRLPRPASGVALGPDRGRGAGVADPPKPPPSVAELLEAYGDAVELAERGASVEAFARFERIRADAKRSPDSGELGAKAHFWTARLAPTPDESLTRYDALALEHAASALAPTALAAATIACDAFDRPDEARRRRIDLVDRYPASEEARDAALALVRLGPGALRTDYLRWLGTHAPDSPQAAAARREAGGDGSDG